MTEARYDVVGIGNAIVDIIGRADDAFLARHGAAKGAMRLVDAETASALYEAMGPATEISGGSVANTMVGVASFGGRAAFVGKVADDEFGRIFAHDIRAAGVAFNARPTTEGKPTSRSLVLVTPDGERTMNTFLGVSTDFDPEDIDLGLIQASAVLYLEGYLFDRPQSKAAFRQASDIARSAGRKVALTLSDPFCVERHRAEFLDLVRGGVDILFANEREVMALYEAADFAEAARLAARDAPLAALTRSEKGSVILNGGETILVPAQPVASIVDLTGAGDLYAAGFLFGRALGRDLATCGRLGSLAAAEVIGHVGARPERALSTLARERRLAT